MITQVSVLLVMLFIAALIHYSGDPKSDQPQETHEIEDHDDVCYDLRYSSNGGCVYLFPLVWFIGSIIHAWIKFIADESIPGGEGRSPPKLDPIHDFPRWFARVIVLVFVGMTIWAFTDLLLFSIIEKRFKFGRYRELDREVNGDVEAGVVGEETPLMQAQNGYQGNLTRAQEQEDNWVIRVCGELCSVIPFVTCVL